MMIQLKNAVISVSDKTNLEPLAKALHQNGTILYASSGTKVFLTKAGIPCRSVEEITKTPEAFQGRMKTLSFPLLSGVLSRRGDKSDLADLKKLDFVEIDVVIVNFYPFEQAKEGSTQKELTELIDIGGPTLVRAAAKNSESVLVLTNPQSYDAVIEELKNKKGVSQETLATQARQAWERILQYDQAIAERITGATQPLRYGENPHQKAKLEVSSNSPLEWKNPLGSNDLSYNNVLDMSSAFYLGRELKHFLPNHTSVVIVKHNNPCGVASVPISTPEAQLRAMELAWSGDPVSAFGGVILFTDPVTESAQSFFKQKFVDVMVAPRSDNQNDYFSPFFETKKKLKGVWINHWDWAHNQETWKTTTIPGGKIHQTLDEGVDLEIKPQSGLSWNVDQFKLAQFGSLVTRALKSNSIGIVHMPEHDVFQLVGAGQGQPNRIDALSKLAIPRALQVLAAAGLDSKKEIGKCILVSDAFFPFKDSIEVSAELGIKWIIQPGGSIRDTEVIDRAKELNISLAFTGRRHFNH